MIVELLIVVGALATAVCFTRGQRGLGIIGALSGAAVLIFYLVVGSALESALPGLIGGTIYAVGMSIAAVATRRGDSTTGPAPARQDVVKRSVVGGLIGIVPGVLVMGVPIALHAMDVITSDQSQVGFLGIFFIPVGLIAGAAIGAFTAKPEASDEKVDSAPR